MSDHLPDCFLSEPWNATTNPQICVCDRLRACEQRRDMENAPIIAAMCNDEYASGYSDALDAAREAVAALPSWNYTYGGNPPMVEGPPQYGAWMVKAKALAAIDALRRESDV